MGTVGNALVKSICLTIPEWGGWSATATFEGDPLPKGPTVVTVGTLKLNGTVVRSSSEFPGQSGAMIRGGVGWLSSVTNPISFQSDAGVRLSTVLSAIATAAGQSIEQPSDTTIGNYYEAIASRGARIVRYADLLTELQRSGCVERWRVDPDWVTRFGSRTSVEITDRATLERNDPLIGSITYGADDCRQFLPGNTINGVRIASSVIQDSFESLTITIYQSKDTGSPSIAELIRQSVADAFDNMVRTYVVHSCSSDGRMDLVPPSDAPHLPEMRNVEQWSFGGSIYTPDPGEEVIVMFRDGNHSRPFVAGFKLTSKTVSRFARSGDTVKSLLPPLILGLGSTVTTPAGVYPIAGFVTAAMPNILGVIETGSRDKRGS